MVNLINMLLKPTSNVKMRQLNTIKSPIPLCNKKWQYKFVLMAKGSRHLFSEWQFHPTQKEERNETAQEREEEKGGVVRHFNLFNIERWPQVQEAPNFKTENRNNGCVLIVTLQALAQPGTEGDWLKGRERWVTLWKGHGTLIHLGFSRIFLSKKREKKRKNKLLCNKKRKERRFGMIFYNALVK